MPMPGLRNVGTVGGLLCMGGATRGSPVGTADSISAALAALEMTTCTAGGPPHVMVGRVRVMMPAPLIVAFNSHNRLWKVGHAFVNISRPLLSCDKQNTCIKHKASKQVILAAL